MIKVTNIQAARIMGVLLILLSSDAFAVTTYATQAGLNTEITNRKTGDSTETARATKAEGALKTADTAEVTNRNAAIASETTRATGAEGTLKAAITAETARAIASEAATGSFTYLTICGVSGTDACKIGARGPSGGWIFFVDYNQQYDGFDYLEAAETDIEAVNWCSDTYKSIPAVAGWSANAVGAGQANTTAMTVAGACRSGAANSAKAYFTSTTQAGDWFLGSEGEMMLMYTNLRQAGVGGFVYGAYWSSTEYYSYGAFAQFFNSGDQSYANKNSLLSVRAVRAF